MLNLHSLIGGLMTKGELRQLLSEYFFNYLPPDDSLVSNPDSETELILATIPVADHQELPAETNLIELGVPSKLVK